MSLVSRFSEQQGQDSQAAQESTSLLSRVRSSYQAPEPVSRYTGINKALDVIASPLNFVNEMFFKPTVATLAKPFGETVASSAELAKSIAPEMNIQAPAWAQRNRLSSPEILATEKAIAKNGIAQVVSNPQVRNQISQLTETLRQNGYQGANFTDVLNVLSLLPGGAAAKGVAEATGKVAAGSSRFLPTLGTALKEAVPVSTAIGGAYGLAGAVDEKQSATDTALSTIYGAAIGAGLGVLAGTAGATVGTIANKVGQTVSKDLATKAIVDKNEKAITTLINGNKSIRNAFADAERQGHDIQNILTNSDILVGSVDENGRIRTTTPGGAIEKVDSIIQPGESSVMDNIVREGKTMPLSQVEQYMMDSVKESKIRGAATLDAARKVQAEIEALRQEFGDNVPLAAIQELKIYKGSNIDYSNPNAKNADKAITNGLKRFVEDNVDGIDVRATNKELSKFYALRDVLEALDGKVIKGGKLGKYFSQVVGAMVGGQVGGPIGSVIGAEVGGKIRGAQLQSAFAKGTGNMPALSDEMIKAIETGKTAMPESALIPESRRIGQTITTPSTDTSRLLTQEEAKARLQELGAWSGLSSEDLNQSSQRGSLTMSHITATTDNTKAISESIAATPKVDINSIESLDAEITRRIEKFRSEAGIVAQREGAGLRTRTTDTGIDAADERTFTSFSLNQAKGTMKAQADSAKKYAQTMLYENDPEFRSLVDMKDALLETKIVEAKTVPEVDALFSKVDDEIKTIENEKTSYESNTIDETPRTSEENQGNGIGKEKGIAKIDPSLLSEAKKYKTVDDGRGRPSAQYDKLKKKWFTVYDGKRYYSDLNPDDVPE